MSRALATKLLACPFCGFQMPPDEDENLIDILYPTGTYWRVEPDGLKHYVNHKERQPGDSRCWHIICDCGAEVHADTREGAITAWNRRAPNAGVASLSTTSSKGGNSDAAN
jgi:hypothetical protein